MKLNLRILLPTLAKALGRKELELEFGGETVGDLVEDLVEQYGRKVRQALLDEEGELDPVVQVLLNGKEWVSHDRLDTALQDGDTVVLMMMMAGG
jgi:molybdopterin synthase sulfur carrier subunit